VIKTLHVLDYCHDPVYRRAIHRILNRGESRNSLARDIFHGRRGQLRQHYQTGQEDQLGAQGPRPKGPPKKNCSSPFVSPGLLIHDDAGGHRVKSGRPSSIAIGASPPQFCLP
jgi:hypothetical protein